MSGRARVCIVEASAQNVFFGELLGVLATLLERAGVEVARASDHFPAAPAGTVYLFVPHEYLPLTDVRGHPAPAQLARSIAIATEQPGTTWFEQVAEAASGAGAVVDLSPVALAEWARRGIEAQPLPLGHLEPWDRWGGDDDAERPVDVLFLGGHTERRGRILAGCAAALAGREVRMHLSDNLRPHVAGEPGFVQGERKLRLLSRAKLIVNVHRGELPYFEWLRAAEALTNGCVIVTEHSLGFEPLRPQEHFVTVAPEHLPQAIAALLEDPERLAAIRRAGYDFAREHLSSDATGAALAGVVERLASATAAEPLEAPPGSMPAARPLPAPPSQLELIAGGGAEPDVVRAALKRVLIEQQQLKRRLDRAAAGEEPRDRVWEHGPRAGRRPRIAVIVPVYNHAGVVGDAIRSVALSEFRDLELVVVDDGSTDGSLDAARHALAEHPWVAAKIVGRGANHGLAAARNLGIAESAAPLLFMLDADNALYAHGLGRLAAALDGDPGAAFAYGIIAQQGPAGPHGLLSWGRWSARRLAHGNYVDAMALVRRESVERAGGYTRDPRLHGWEDYALWCALAEAGERGVLVPEIVARYRVSPHSMISVTNLDASESYAALAARYPRTLAGTVEEPAVPA